MCIRDRYPASPTRLLLLQNARLHLFHRQYFGRGDDLHRDAYPLPHQIDRGIPWVFIRLFGEQGGRFRPATADYQPCRDQLYLLGDGDG